MSSRISQRFIVLTVGKLQAGADWKRAYKPPPYPAKPKDNPRRHPLSPEARQMLKQAREHIRAMRRAKSDVPIVFWDDR